MKLPLAVRALISLVATMVMVLLASGAYLVVRTLSGLGLIFVGIALMLFAGVYRATRHLD